MYSIVGSYIPFAATAPAGQEHRETRPTLAERYRSQADYVRRVALAVQQLMEQRLLLPEDADRYIDTAMHTEALLQQR